MSLKLEVRLELPQIGLNIFIASYIIFFIKCFNDLKRNRNYFLITNTKEVITTLSNTIKRAIFVQTIIF